MAILECSNAQTLQPSCLIRLSQDKITTMVRIFDLYTFPECCEHVVTVATSHIVVTSHLADVAAEELRMVSTLSVKLPLSMQGGADLGDSVTGSSESASGTYST